jgi:predicted deacetylase
MVYSVRGGWRRQVSLLWNAFLYRKLRAAPLVRLALHPVDYEHPRVWKQILGFAGAMATDRQVTTYDAWLDSPRGDAP